MLKLELELLRFSTKSSPNGNKTVN